MSKLQIILTVGISNSGKTTWAEEYTRNRSDWVNINRDDYRFSLFNRGVRDWSQYKFNRANEKKVTELVDSHVEVCKDLGHNIIISDTNLNPLVVTKWDFWAEANGYELIIKEFHISYDEALKRDNSRVGGIGLSISLIELMKRK
jgi:tRNA uridine 5-carbamoylmethylation protein Kti12